MFCGKMHLENTTTTIIMRPFRLLATLSTLLLCIALSSCTKEDVPSAYDQTIWSGSYPVQMLNNTTREWEDHTACISLQFTNSAQECKVLTGIAGLLAANMNKYSVDWISDDSFSLYETNDDQKNIIQTKRKNKSH